ncbi:MAG: NADPH:quinone reductase [Hyphomicrobiaceae bacterium]|nr:NADPH:quinone reductase [Hyphomicrobiaceae bacterium]
MRAVWYERTGPADNVLIVGEQPMPEPAPGEARIRLMASGVNPADCYRRAGSGYRMEAPLVIAHSDGAGVVDKLGPGVSHLAEGERVWLYNGQRNGRTHGTGAEYIALDADLVTALPDTVPIEAGACLGIPCMTAHRCVLGSGPVEGQWVLVTGGGGAVGNYAIQLAKWAGAKVIATAGRGWQAEDARRAGADIVLDRDDENLAARILAETEEAGANRIVDVDFGGNIDWTKDAVAANGVIAAYATRGNPAPEVPFQLLMRKNVTIQGVLLPTTPHAARKRAQTDILRWLKEAPRLHRVVGPFPLEETASAHMAVEAGGKRGTVVVAPQM